MQNITTFLACAGTPSFLGVFDLSYAPALLYYSYIPIIIVSLFLSVLVLIKVGKRLTSISLCVLSISFAMWSLLTIFEWLTVPSSLNLFAWELTSLFELPIFIATVYFVYSFITQKKPKIFLNIILLLPYLFVIFLTPTKYNIIDFDTLNCNGKYLLQHSVYMIEIMYIIIPIVIYLFAKYKKVVLAKGSLALSIFSSIFLLIFWTSNVWGELTLIYSVALIGPIGLLIFIAFLTFMIVHFKAFNLKLIGAQAIVWSLIILIGSQFFYLAQMSLSVVIITAITLIVASTLGINLVSSVKKEVVLREHLEIANAGQANLIHIMNHQIKGYLSISKNIFAELLTDDYGKVPDDAKDIITAGLENADKGTKYVTAILKGDSAESGTLLFDMKPMDYCKLVEEVVEKERMVAEKKGLKLNFESIQCDYNIIGDIAQLGEAVRDLIDNSIFYTPSGSILVNLSNKGNTVLLKVKDTGVGIKPEDAPKLFKAGGVGSESIKININSSGYGLAFVKGVIEKHNGKVWFESAGYNKGSTFYIELPVK